ncbi:MAG TPA: amidohydrolase [Bryobacteraceae bacterium]|jgi:predicted amidohydrolase YtcJ|nr:amidohydrolase [Bryobacteraceae bacterium]
MRQQAPDLIVHNGKLVTEDERLSIAQAAAVREGRFVAVGTDREVLALKGEQTKVVNLNGRTAIPGLNDSHTHLIRGGLNYNLELRWDGVPSLADGLRMLREQARRTPTGQWVRVVGGWSEFQFAERRMPTLDELNQAAPDTPVFVLHLYDRALLNRAAMRAVGYTKDTPNPPGGEIVRDASGNPSGILIARPNAMILYSTLAKGPKLPAEYQANSSRHFMRELNRLGITSVIDAGGGFQNYPDDYEVIEQLHKNGELTVRIAYNLFTQKPKEELADFQRWTGMLKSRQGDDYLRHNGAGEMLVFSAADFEDFLEARPDLPSGMEQELKPVVTHLAQNRWPFRLHATYDESITRALNVYEEVNREVPLKGLHWFIDHAETISPRNIERIAALGGGIAVQHRMAYQGEYFRDRYGETILKRSPPIREMLRAGIPVGGGTDATRVASYNPFVSLYWLVTGRTVGGLAMYDANNRLDRMEALRLWTVGSSWFSTEQESKGAIVPGQFADLAILSADYLSVPENEIKQLESVLTIIGGKPVYGAEEFSELAPPAPPVLPEWSPIAAFGGYAKSSRVPVTACSPVVHARSHHGCTDHAFSGGFGCFCWAF